MGGGGDDGLASMAAPARKPVYRVVHPERDDTGHHPTDLPAQPAVGGANRAQRKNGGPSGGAAAGAAAGAQRPAPLTMPTPRRHQSKPAAARGASTPMPTSRSGRVPLPPRSGPPAPLPPRPPPNWHRREEALLPATAIPGDQAVVAPVTQQLPAAGRSILTLPQQELVGQLRDRVADALK